MVAFPRERGKGKGKRGRYFLGDTRGLFYNLVIYCSLVSCKCCCWRFSRIFKELSDFLFLLVSQAVEMNCGFGNLWFYITLDLTIFRLSLLYYTLLYHVIPRKSQELQGDGGGFSESMAGACVQLKSQYSMLLYTASLVFCGVLLLAGFGFVDLPSGRSWYFGARAGPLVGWFSGLGKAFFWFLSRGVWELSFRPRPFAFRISMESGGTHGVRGIFCGGF